MRCRQRTECRSRTSMMKAPSCTGTFVCLYIAYFTYTFVSSFYIVAFVIIFVQCRCIFIIFTTMANHPGALWRTPLPTRPATPPATLSRSWEPALAATARWSEIFFISINHDVMIFQIMISTSVMVRADVHRNHKDIDK